MYLLFDCNNFFASCEQIFRPDWRGRPLVVLSNNDGCVIARSAEAKAAGIAMAEPYFKCRERLEHIGGIVCSANFALYSDFSERVISILEQNLPSVEQYSIDEAFAKLGDENLNDWEAEGRALRRRIKRWTGISVSVGLAPSKTLAKLANELAKKSPEARGMISLRSESDWRPILERTPISNIWGIGRRLAPRMQGLGIRTAAQLADSSLELLRRNFGVSGERIALELRGSSCIEDNCPNPRGQIMVSRSLKEGVKDWEQLRATLCRFVEKATRNLRDEKMMARSILVILRTSAFESEEQSHASSLSINLSHHSDDTREITAAAITLLKQAYRSGYNYKKVGILLSELQPIANLHPSFDRPRIETSPLMSTLDTLQRAGHNIHFANQGQGEAWHRAFSSPCYTSDWESLPEAH